MHRQFLEYVTVTLILVFVAWTTPADEKTRAWHGIQKMMTPDEYRSAGLEKLSPEELSNLNQWFMRFIAHDSQQVVKTDTVIKEMQSAPVRRRIAGTFHGWDGKTIFTLDNGEVWRQRLPGRYFVKLENPEVEIFKNLLGFYELKVVETGKRVGVSRVK
jgi:hypothetical protein